MYCIAETGQARLVHSTKALSGTFAELQDRYEKHKAVWTNEREAQARLETVEAIARLDDPQVVPFLLRTVQKEPHWDICEEAVKSLARKGPSAIDPLIGLLPDKRPFVRTVAINGLGRLKAAKALPQLLVATHDKEPLVRCAALQALAQIAQDDNTSVARVTMVLAAVLVDRKEEAVVKESALDGIAILAGKAGARARKFFACSSPCKDAAIRGWPRRPKRSSATPARLRPRRSKRPGKRPLRETEEGLALRGPVTRYENRRADLMQTSTCCMSESENLPMTRNTSRWSTVSTCSPLTAELWSNPVIRPSGAVTSIKSCDGSFAARLFVVVMMATTVEFRRLFSESFCATRAGRTFVPAPDTNDMGSSTTSPRLTLIA